MRLDHLLVSLGVGTRKEVQRLIRAGEVRVSEVTVRDPGMHVTENAEMALHGEALDTRLTRHVMLHKPTGVLTAARDPKQKTVMDLLPPVFTSLGCMPCGRLDKDTEGLLLLTTDGELSHRLLAPSRHVDKCYEALVQGKLEETAIGAFAQGMDLGDFVASPAKLQILSAEEPTSLAQVTVHEGKFHEVRRMFDKVGHPVLTLKRLTFGPLVLEDTLPAGQWRELTEEETAALYQAAGMTDHGHVL